MKIEKILDEELDSVLTEEMTFGENRQSILNHYNRHVLKEGEEFDPNDPKFNHMSLLEYATACNDLVIKKCSCDFSSDTFGWVQYRQGDNDYTIVKYTLYDGRPGGWYAKVVYRAYDNGGIFDLRDAYTYMLNRGGIARIKRQYQNQKDNGTWVADLDNKAAYTEEELNKFDEMLSSK